MDENSAKSSLVPPTIFRTLQPVLFSALIEKKMGLTLTWTKWRHKELEVRGDATLWVRDFVASSGNSTKPDPQFPMINTLTTTLAATITSPLQTLSPGLASTESYNITKITLTQMNHNALEGNGTDRDYGLLLDLATTEGHETKIRCILNDEQFHDFTDALQCVCKEHNLDSVRQVSITQQVEESTGKYPSRHRRIVSTARAHASTMRLTIAMAMDSVDTRSKVEQIIAKRGVFQWLPVFFSNDLVHGAWWFVVASILFTISSAVVLDNSLESFYLGEDDSFLDPLRYRISWILMTISGAFFVVGSMAFVRATHSDPPMKPLFSKWYYHIQNDELLGSWLFFFGTVPVIPYILLYLQQSKGAYIYWVALIVAIVFVFATYLFVRACYPNDNGEAQTRLQIIKPITRALICCCCSQEFLDRHLPNDWLAGNWIFFVGLFVGSICSIILFLYSLIVQDNLLIFIMGSTLLEMVGYTIGSAYWTAGSYPDPANAGDPDDAETGRRFYPYNANNNPHFMANSTHSHLSPSLLTWFFRNSLSGSASSPSRGATNSFNNSQNSSQLSSPRQGSDSTINNATNLNTNANRGKQELNSELSMAQSYKAPLL